MQIIELLKQHIEEMYKDYQLNGSEMSLLMPYLKDETSKELPSNIAVIVPLIPDMLKELVDLMLNSKASEQNRALATGIYSYAFNPIDYIPDTSDSIFGFVDDALVLFYGLHLIEEKEVGFKSKTIQQEKLIDGVKECEDFLSEAIIFNLKNYPSQVNNSIRVE